MSLSEEIKMSKLISGKEALIALAGGEVVEYWCENDPSIQKRWTEIKRLDEYKLSYFLDDKPRFEFRLKPRTITINGIEFSPCVSIGICRIKNEVSIQLKDEGEADRLYALLTNLFGFRG